MMEYAPGGELFVRLAECGSYTEHEAKPIFAQIASAVQYMVISLDINYNLYRTEYFCLGVLTTKPLEEFQGCTLLFTYFLFSVKHTL